MQRQNPSLVESAFTPGLRTVCSVLAVTACLTALSAQAGDQGARRHARGAYDTVTATYAVVDGDEIDVISERFEVPVADLKAQNKLSSDELNKGQKLVIGAAADAGPATGTRAAGVGVAADAKKPNILFIMGDDIGWMQPSIYHQGLMVGETPNIDRIGNEGAKFMSYYAEQSCTAGRTAFFTGMTPLRAGMIPPQLPGSPSFLQPGTPALAKFLLDLGYTTGEFGKNHLGDHSAALPTAHGFQEFWGYLYHLDAMQGVSFPDINSSPTVQAIVAPCKNTPVRGLSDPAGAVDAKTTLCMTPPRPVIACKSPDGTEKNQSCSDQGPLTLKRSETVDEEISAKVIDFLDRNDPKKTN
ncbi:MAG TPA: sulfatase-like hydrolase/transferase, partial [Lamprocystis sp. (in: g-proteobacteria)]|nr:sulfatase-like hydrolase/transferase [Lamprocystis sp. (in: g-proteobacteria)]